MDVRSKTTSEFRTVFPSPSQVALYTSPMSSMEFFYFSGSEHGERRLSCVSPNADLLCRLRNKLCAHRSLKLAFFLQNIKKICPTCMYHCVESEVSRPDLHLCMLCVAALPPYTAPETMIRKVCVHVPSVHISPKTHKYLKLSTGVTHF